MPDALVLYPVLALILPGGLAYGLGRSRGRVWPGLILALLSLGAGVVLLGRATGADWNDSVATNAMLAAFGLAFPALVSSVIGTLLAYRRGRSLG